MTRSINIFTMSDMGKIGNAMLELNATAEKLPEGSRLQVFLNNERNLFDKLPGTFFGDIVEVIDFPYEWQAAEWEDSAAYEDQRKRTKGLFSSATNLSYPLVEGGEDALQI